MSVFFNLFKNQWMAAEGIFRLQNRKLRRLMAFAYNETPYYRHLFDQAGLKPEDVDSLQTLHRFPTTDRKTLQSLPRDKLISGSFLHRRLVEERTSGSTGSPLTTYKSRFEKNRFNLIWARAFRANGVGLRDKRFFIEDDRNMNTSSAWFQRLGIWRKYSYSCFESPSTLARILIRERPSFLYAYPSTLMELTDWYTANATVPEFPRPKHIFTAAELLSPGQRKKIEKCFGSEPADLYGTTELGLIAWQCPERKGYHMNVDTLIVEFMRNERPAQPGEEGEIICTSLDLRAMPLIRYRVGDTGVPAGDPCSCGRTLPLMHVLSGREADHIVLPDGERLSPYRLTCALENVPYLRRYQIIQDGPKEIRVLFEPLAGFQEEDAAKIKTELTAYLGSSMSVQAESSNHFEKTASGKFQVVLSKLGERQRSSS